MRVTTLFNKLLNLQGLWVTGLRFEGDALVILDNSWWRLSCRNSVLPRNLWVDR
jgi:hypothetical protein